PGVVDGAEPSWLFGCNARDSTAEARQEADARFARVPALAGSYVRRVRPSSSLVPRTACNEPIHQKHPQQLGAPDSDRTARRRPAACEQTLKDILVDARH